MDAKDYCQSIEHELFSWKAKMYDLVRRTSHLRSADQEKIASKVDELHQAINTMEGILSQLQAECPVAFGPQKDKLEKTSAGMKKEYDDTMAAVLQF
jgi:hypothetical protein